MLLAIFLNDANSQPESDGNKETSERPLEDPVGSKPEASGDPSPGNANEDSTEGENEEEREAHNYGVRPEHHLRICEGHFYGCPVTKGELDSSLVIVLGNGAARV